MHLTTIPAARAAEDPDGPALADDSVTLSNREFDDAVGRAAAVLSSVGVADGSVVAIMLPNTVEFVVALFAAWRVGAVVTPVNPALGPVEIAFQLSDCRASVVITDSALIDRAPSDVGVVIEILSENSPGDLPRAAVAATSPSDLALLVYTSGTTGTPKGVMLDHANLTAMIDMTVDEFSLDVATHSLLILPLFHVNGIVVGALSPLAAGGRATIAGRFDPRTFFDRVESARPTYFSGVPTIYTMLANLPDSVRPDTSSLAFAVCGAAPAGAELLERFENRFGVPVVEGYGLSEGTCASTVNPLAGPRKAGTVGLPLPGQSIRIADPDGLPVVDGTPGEVLIKGPNVMRGYLRRPEETAATLVDGWLRTGDIGLVDEDGYLVLVDRAKDMIIRSGENIYPKEIENVVYQLDGVLEAGVVGQPHPVRGEEPVLFVSLNAENGLSENDIRAHLTRSLAKYKQPVDIIVVDDVPKNPVGKIDKPALRRRLRAPAVVSGR